MQFPFQIKAPALPEELNCLKDSLSNSTHRRAGFSPHLERTHSHLLQHMWRSAPLCLSGVIAAIWPPTTAENTHRIPRSAVSLSASICRANYEKFCLVAHNLHSSLHNEWLNLEIPCLFFINATLHSFCTLLAAVANWRFNITSAFYANGGLSST